MNTKTCIYKLTDVFATANTGIMIELTTVHILCTKLLYMLTKASVIIVSLLPSLFGL